jgi:two-component system chemotaxis response regulator CheB
VTQAARPLPPPGDVARVMICDDSVVIRGAIARMLEGEPSVRVVARVANGRQALDELKRQQIDVAVLDIEMPEMDGMEALPLLLRADPGLRIVMASTLTTRGADIALRALRLGAADYIPKPSTAAIADDSFRRELIAKVTGLARLRRRAASPAASTAPGRIPNVSASAPLQLRPASKLKPRLLAIGSSTGGPQALFTFVQGLGKALPVPVVLTQHMPPAFTPMLAEHLSKLGGPNCAEARDGETLETGRLYLAPGDRHLLIASAGAKFVVRLSDSPPENYCRPSVDPMLRSATTVCGGAVLMVMLTGMGHDGLNATRELIAAGGAALAQDEATSVVWGMPGAIAQAGLCHKILPLTQLAGATLDLLKGGRT